MSYDDVTHSRIPDAEALRPEWDDLHEQLKPLHRALCGLLAAVHISEERTSAMATRWAEAQGGTADDHDEHLARFIRASGIEPVSILLEDLAGQLP